MIGESFTVLRRSEHLYLLRSGDGDLRVFNEHAGTISFAGDGDLAEQALRCWPAFDGDIAALAAAMEGATVLAAGDEPSYPLPYPWRQPAQESTGLYPGLVVHDGRVSGSITVGRSRLPLWALVSTLVEHGWEQVVDTWPQIESEQEFTARALTDFLYFLLDGRGEIARLLLELAAAEREEAQRAERDGTTMPWWQDPARRGQVRAQLQRCLDALAEPDPTDPAPR